MLLHQTLASEGVRGKDVKAVAGTTHESIFRTENTNTAGTENIQRNDDETRLVRERYLCVMWVPRFCLSIEKDARKKYIIFLFEVFLEYPRFCSWI